VDAKRFDTLARVVGTSSDRRDLFKAAAGGALGLVGLSALASDALADDVGTEAKHCNKDKDCKTRTSATRRKTSASNATRAKIARTTRSARATSARISSGADRNPNRRSDPWPRFGAREASRTRASPGAEHAHWWRQGKDPLPPSRIPEKPSMGVVSGESVGVSRRCSTHRARLGARTQTVAGVRVDEVLTSQTARCLTPVLRTRPGIWLALPRASGHRTLDHIPISPQGSP
jgi:hypothetical protein